MTRSIGYNPNVVPTHHIRGLFWDIAKYTALNDDAWRVGADLPREIGDQLPRGLSLVVIKQRLKDGGIPSRSGEVAGIDVSTLYNDVEASINYRINKINGMFSIEKSVSDSDRSKFVPLEEVLALKALVGVLANQ